MEQQVTKQYSFEWNKTLRNYTYIQKISAMTQLTAKKNVNSYCLCGNDNDVDLFGCWVLTAVIRDLDFRLR